MIGPNPFGRPGHICTTRAMEEPAYRRLPRGLGAGVRVRTLSSDGEYWIVERIDQPGGQQWRVHTILLMVELDPPDPKARRRV